MLIRACTLIDSRASTDACVCALTRARTRTRTHSILAKSSTLTSGRLQLQRQEEERAAAELEDRVRLMASLSFFPLFSAKTLRELAPKWTAHNVRNGEKLVRGERDPPFMMIIASGTLLASLQRSVPGRRTETVDVVLRQNDTFGKARVCARTYELACVRACVVSLMLQISLRRDASAERIETEDMVLRQHDAFGIACVYVRVCLWNVWKGEKER